MMIVKKRFLYGLIFCLCLVLAAPTVGSAANINLTASNTIRIDNEDVKFTNDIYIIDNKTYVPLRELAEKMRIPIEWNEEKGQAELLTYFKTVNVGDRTEFKEEGVIPDAETAYQIGKIILEKYTGTPMEYETDEYIVYLRTTYYEHLNVWYVSQTFKFKDENRGWASGNSVYSPTVYLNKDTGEVIALNTYSTLEEVMEKFSNTKWECPYEQLGT